MPHSKPLFTFTFSYASAVIALIIFTSVGQLLIQSTLGYEVYARNQAVVIGRQQSRILHILRDAMLLENAQLYTVDHAHTVNEILTLSVQFEQVDQAVPHGDAKLGISSLLPQEVYRQAAQVEPDFFAIRSAITAILAREGTIPHTESIDAPVTVLVAHTDAYVTAYNSIYFLLAGQADLAVENTSRIEYMLYAAFLLVLFAEILFVYRPAYLKLRRSLYTLSQQAARPCDEARLEGTSTHEYEEASPYENTH